MTTVYITKYALTDEIQEFQLDDGGREDPFFYKDGVVVKDPHGCNRVSLFHKPDWYLDRGEAVARANVMKVKKIASLEKQIDKLKQTTFA